jgi:Flp pilus assembly protein TadB
MATKKQRRRRDKGRRHEYEYVYIDEEGNEVEVEQPPPSRKEKERRAVVSSNGRRPAAGARPVQPPSWRFMRKQALIFFVILFGAFAILSKGVAIWVSAGIAALYTALMLPLMWMMQRTMYRSYLRRTGQLPPRQKRDSK